jgi:hypothetical protein
MERLGKHFSAEMNSCNSRSAVFSVRSKPRGYKQDKGYRLSQLSFETPTCQNINLEVEELNWRIEFPELAFRRMIEKTWHERN